MLEDFTTGWSLNKMTRRKKMLGTLISTPRNSRIGIFWSMDGFSYESRRSILTQVVVVVSFWKSRAHEVVSAAATTTTATAVP
jgi:hypothetical protein